MAQAPFNGVPSVTPTGPVGVNQSISANPGQFGGLIGQAEQGFGGQLMRTSEQVAHAAAQLQDFNNTQAAREANNDFLNEMGQTYAEYASLEGKAAYDGYKPFQEKLNQLYTQRADSMKSPAAREAFENSARYSMSRMLMSASVYAASQNRKSLIQTNDATMQTQLQHSMLMQNDPKSVAVAEANYVAAARDNAIQHGMSPEDTDAYVQKASGKFWHDMVLFKLNTPESQGGGPMAATALFNQVKTKMDPTSMLTVQNVIKDKAETDIGISAGTKYFNGALNGGNDSVPPQPLVNAITGQEGSRADQVSVNGARGTRQVTPIFFATYAKPGESFDSEKDRVAVSDRGIAALSEQYNGDPARVAVAYFSGPSNVAPAGSPRPYLIDKKDGNGTSTSQYVDGVLNRLRQSQGAGAQPQSAPSTQPLMVVGNPDGLVSPGNLDLNARPIVKNKDGSVSTVRSMTITNDQGQAVLIPTVIGDKVVSDGDAIRHYDQTGQNLGVFDTIEHADTYAQSLHQQQEQYAAGKVAPSTAALPQTSAAYAANVQAQVAQAQADAYRRIMADPNLSDKAKESAMRHVNQQAQATLIALEAKTKAKSEMNNAAADTWVQKINGGATPDMIQQINSDQTITDWRTRQSLIELAMKKAGVEDTSSYGKAYTDLYKRIVAPDGDPNRITTVNDILSRGGPDGDLTLPGVQKLVSVFQLTKKDVDQRGVHTTVSSLLTYARNKLSFEQDLGPIKIRDPKGEAIYNGEFVPKFEAAFAAWQKAGKDPMQFLTRKNVDELVEGLRSPADMARDKLLSTGEATAGTTEKGNEAAPPVPLGLNGREWSNMMTAPPVADNGKYMTKAIWGEILRRMVLAKDQEKFIRQFDEKFGPAGYSGAEIVNRLRGSSGATRQSPPALGVTDVRQD